MTDFTWRIDDEDGDPELTGTAQPLVVTWRIIRDALRRAWRWCVGATILGGLLGVLALAALPHPASATTTLLLVHPNGDDPSAMSTDVTILMTRAVANEVIDELGLPNTTPDALHGTMSVEPLTDQLLKVTVTADDDATAVTRSTAIIDAFLAFRGKELRSISGGIVEGYQKRVSELQARVDELTKEYAELSDSDSTDQASASDILTQRAQLGSQISSMQQAIEEASLQTEAAISATHVIDEPYADTHVSKRAVVLYGASGALLLGTLTVGVVLFRALTSDRLRRRRDIADALGVPVRVGVGSLRSPGPAARVGRWVRARSFRVLAALTRGRHGRAPRDRSDRDLEALVRGLESAIPARTGRRGGRPRKGRHPDARQAAGPATLAVAAIDDTETASRVLLAVGDRQAQHGTRVILVDLTEHGSLEACAGRRPTGTGPAGPGPHPSTGGDAVRRPPVLRPPGAAPLSRGPRRGTRRHSAPADPVGDLLQAEWNDADLALVLVEMDPGLDIDNLTTWATRIVPLVSAGRASRELLRTVAGMVASAQLDMPFALVEGVDRSDETSGVAEQLRAEGATVLAELQ